MSASSDITQQANSNLAFALKILPRERRRDMQTFYAFCRVVDDIADDDLRSIEEREQTLQGWSKGLLSGFQNPSPLQQEVVEMVTRNDIPTDLLLGIVEGCMLDLHVSRMRTWEELEDYIWKVSCTVGLVSIRLFGCHARESESYAIELAKALQITNILRDIHEDFTQRNRIYLPLQDLHQFGYSEEDLAEQVHDERFVKLMDYQTQRAENAFHESAINLTRIDHRALRPARIMSDIYHDLLRQMRNDRYQVFQKRYRVSKGRKLQILIKHLLS